MSLISTSTDSVTVSWSVPTGTVVETFDLHWSVEGDQQPLTTSTDTVDNSTNNYIISGLSELENATVMIVVISTNKAGRNSSVPLIFHSDILRDSATQQPTVGSSDTNLRVIIGGAVGIFFASIVLGIFIFFIGYRITRQCQKKSNRYDYQAHF